MEICVVARADHGDDLLIWAAAHTVFAKYGADRPTRDLLTFLGTMLGVHEGTISRMARGKLEYLGML
mgnify:CR=1 FL=1